MADRCESYPLVIVNLSECASVRSEWDRECVMGESTERHSMSDGQLIFSVIDRKSTPLEWGCLLGFTTMVHYDTAPI